MSQKGVLAGIGMALAVAMAGVLPMPAAAQNAKAVIDKATAAMGGKDLNSLSYTAEGIGYTFGQAYEPGKAWPKIQISSLTRTINYSTGSMRDLITISRAEPKGGWRLSARRPANQ